MTPEELKFLRKAAGVPMPEGVEKATTSDEVKRILETFEASASPEWQQTARECELWIKHVAVIREQIHPSQLPEFIVGAIAKAVSDLGALSAILYGKAQELDESDRSLLEGIASDVAEAGARAFSRAVAAWDLLTADASQGRPG